MRIIFLFSLLISRCNKNQKSFKTYTVIIFVKCRKEQGTFFLGTYYTYNSKAIYCKVTEISHRSWTRKKKFSREVVIAIFNHITSI